MAFSDWDSYTGLLDNLAKAESGWSDASDFAEFDAKVRQNCSGLVPNSGGYDELVTRLDASGDYGDADKLFEHLRIVIFAEAADVAELGADWTGYWISKDGDDAQIYAESRGAAVSAWAPMDDAAAAELVTDEVEEVEEVEEADTDVQVLQEQQYDEESGRWRRWSDEDDAFEYFHQDDGVWERVAGDLWSRYHDGAQLWLPYNGPSQTWLYENAWVAYERVNAQDLDALAQRLVAETLADLEEEIEPLTDDERAEAIATVRRELEKERS